MAIDPFSRRPLTPDEWRARARRIESELEGLTIDELMRGRRAYTDERSGPVGRGARGYDPSQPRIPAGHPDGGQWTDEARGNAGQWTDEALGNAGQWTDEALGNAAERINDPRVLSDIEPGDPWILGADYAKNFEHHWYARHFYRRHPFSRETRKVFREATSGPLVQRLYSRRQQKWLSHGYGYDAPHRRYDAAVDELVTEYMRNRGITARQMTPAQAHEVVELIKKSPDPRIRDFVKMINTLHRFFRRFGGRGNE
jgi:hypothetical protein